MTAAGFDDVTHCPDPEEVAAFYEGRLSGAARERVIEHLASCAVCTDLLERTHDFESEERASGRNVTRGGFGWKTWVPAAAAAAVVVAVVLSMRPTAMERLEGAWQYASERPTDARFSGDFSYRRSYTPRSGDKKERTDYAVELEALEVIGRAEKRRTAENLHAAGVAYLISEKRDEALKALIEASKKAPTAAVLTDLSAAYYEIGDYQHAVEAADRALKMERTPAALWNRAVALEPLGDDQKARAAWDEYLRVDPNSEWATEARDRRARLRP